MAALGRLVFTFRRSATSGRHIAVNTAVFGGIGRVNLYVAQKCLIHLSEERLKGDKFNLSNQTRKKKKFRAEKVQEEAQSKLQTFRLDPSDHDDDRIISTSNSARRNALAVTLQQAMTSLLESNDVDQQLLDCNIQITNVKIAQDMGHATFYWLTDKKDLKHQDHITKLLHRNEKILRLLLPSYHHLNVSPRVVFSRDKHVDYLANIDALLDASTQESQAES